MKTFTTTLLLFCICSLHAQWNRQEELGLKITQVFEDSRAIKEMILNKKMVLNQLQDVEKWTQDGTISSETYFQIKDGYHELALSMNAIYDNLINELRSIERSKDFKAKRFEKILKQFNTSNLDELLNAKNIYENKYKPALETAVKESESKSIIPVIAFIFKFGETLFSSIKQLFDEGAISKENEKILISAALDIAIHNLEKKIMYPEWDIEVQTPFFESNISYNRSIERTPSKNKPTSNNEDEAAIQIIDYYSKEPHFLFSTTKQIIVGSEKASSTSILMETENDFKIGERFQVALNNFNYAYFFYYDHESKSWLDPLGKNIIVGSDDGNVKPFKRLPADNQYFEISGDNPYEEFLILMSDEKLTEKLKQHILSSASRGEKFMNELNTEISSTYPYGNFIPEKGSTNELVLKKSKLDHTYLPVYIKINKSIY